MRNYFSFMIIILLSKASFGQSTMGDSIKKISTIGVFDTASYKSGRRINDYYVEITDKQFNKYKGRIVEVSGKLLIVPGIDPNEKVIVQGSSDERKFITEPKIRMVRRSKKNK